MSRSLEKGTPTYYTNQEEYPGPYWGPRPNQEITHTNYYNYYHEYRKDNHEIG